MFADLKPYAPMRDSGVPWLGNLPEHWEVRRLKYVLRERDTRSLSGAEQLLRVSQYTGVTQRRRADGGDEPDTRAESLVGYKQVWPNDLVVNIMLAWNGSLGVSSFCGIASPAYCVYRFGARALPWYFHHLLRSPPYKARIKAVSTGVVESRLRLYTDDLYRLEAFLPPLPEQAAIVRFLDQADRQTRHYIRAKQKLIELLEEQKQVIVHRVVTGGLDPNVRLKPSGVEWLGDVPEHWDSVHLRYLARCLDGRRVPLNAVQRGEMQGEFPYWGANKVIDHVNRWLFDEPLVLLGEDGAPFFERGRDVAFSVSGKVWVNNHAHVLRCGHRIVPGFLAHALNCVDYTGFTDGSTRDKLTQQAMGGITVQVPPIGEQNAIVDTLAALTNPLVSVINQSQREIALLREYHTRLLADVVTGKVDVREAAAQLPVDAEEPEPLDEADALTDAEQDAADDIEVIPEETEA